jgi:hypothetical protein
MIIHLEKRGQMTMRCVYHSTISSGASTIPRAIAAQGAWVLNQATFNPFVGIPLNAAR